MTDPSVPGRADARRNQRALLDAAAAVFVEAGVDAPVRAVAARAGVGMGTIYRHFPTRADLIVAVFRHQVEELVTAGESVLRDEKVDEQLDPGLQRIERCPAALGQGRPGGHQLLDLVTEDRDDLPPLPDPRGPHRRGLPSHFVCC